MDLKTYLLKPYGYGAVFTIVDRFLKHVKLLPCSISSTDVELA